jgi:viroplasmin and RNaseH domain-containing protein
MSNKYYVVTRGHKPGIYDDWEDAKTEMAGYSNSSSKKFTSRKEAEDYATKKGITGGTVQAETDAKGIINTMVGARRSQRNVPKQQDGGGEEDELELKTEAGFMSPSKQSINSRQRGYEDQNEEEEEEGEDANSWAATEERILISEENEQMKDKIKELEEAVTMLSDRVRQLETENEKEKKKTKQAKRKEDKEGKEKMITEIATMVTEGLAERTAVLMSQVGEVKVNKEIVEKAQQETLSSVKDMHQLLLQVQKESKQIREDIAQQNNKDKEQKEGKKMTEEERQQEEKDEKTQDEEQQEKEGEKEENDNEEKDNSWKVVSKKSKKTQSKQGEKQPDKFEMTMKKMREDKEWRNTYEQLPKDKQEKAKKDKKEVDDLWLIQYRKIEDTEESRRKETERREKVRTQERERRQKNDQTRYSNAGYQREDERENRVRIDSRRGRRQQQEQREENGARRGRWHSAQQHQPQIHQQRHQDEQQQQQWQDKQQPWQTWQQPMWGQRPPWFQQAPFMSPFGGYNR